MDEKDIVQVIQEGLQKNTEAMRAILQAIPLGYTLAQMDQRKAGGWEVRTMDGIDDSRTYFTASMNFNEIDEKLRRFVMLRNELIALAHEIGFEVSSGLLELKVK